MTDKPFKIWRSDEAALIRFSTGEQVELSLAAAALLAADLAPRPARASHSHHWSDEKKEELRRLYQDERWTLRRLADHFGLKGPQSMNSALRSLGIPAINQNKSAEASKRMIAARAAKRSSR